MADTVAITRSDRPAEWPDGFLEVAALRENGWKPSPFRQFLFKVHSRCNLSCDYCYVYEMADQSWRSRPVTMSAEVVAQAATRIADHVITHNLDEVRVILHGGEPLMAGREFFVNLATTVREAVPPECTLEFGMQTNAVLLDESFLDVLLTHRIRVGVSLDGGRDANDRHRSYANGRGSYDNVVSAERSNRDLRGLARVCSALDGLPAPPRQLVVSAPSAQRRHDGDAVRRLAHSDLRPVVHSAR